MVKRNEFRSDLYYRLNVFPLSLPPLRARREDIPALVEHFVEIYVRRMSKQIETIPPATMSALASYEWPGNIRELQNFIERSVILSSDAVLRPPLAELKQRPEVQSLGAVTLEEAERDHIRKTLEQTHWVVAGPTGAAARPESRAPRCTLHAKLGTASKEPAAAEQISARRAANFLRPAHLHSPMSVRCSRNRLRFALAKRSS
jgi:formate hydrogenlyase transcriptional activator